MLKAIAVAASVTLCGSGGALAQVYRGDTLCSLVAEGMESGDRGTIRQIVADVLGMLRDLDNKHIRAGQDGIMGRLSDDGASNLVAVTTVHCREHTKETLGKAVVFTYDGVRALGKATGTYR